MSSTEITTTTPSPTPMPPGSPRHDPYAIERNVWTEEHAAPTLADVVLPPRRRLRDGTRASSPKRARTRSTRSGTSTDIETVDEDRRRLPRLRMRERADPRRASPQRPPQEENGPPPSPHSHSHSAPHDPVHGHDHDPVTEHAFEPFGSPTSESSDDLPRFTAQEKGKGRAMPEIIEIDDEPMDESIQFLEHAPAPSRPVKEVQSAIAEDDALSAFSELTPQRR